MDKKIAIYRPHDVGSNKWPDQILASFGNLLLNKFPNDDRLCLDIDSAEASEFFALCNRLGIQVLSAAKLRKISGKELANSPYYFLHVREDKDYIEKYRDIIPLSGMEKSRDTCQCDVAYTQVRKLIIDPAKSKPLDIKRWPYFKHVLIVSRRLKELLENQDFSGFELIPCLDAGKTYPANEQQLEITCHTLEADASYFQLRVTAEPTSPPKVGNVQIGRSRCKTCGTVGAFDPDVELEAWPYFDEGDLADYDIQQAKTVVSSNHGEFPRFTLPVISYRLLQFFIDNKVTGLATFYSEMNIKYEAVWIKSKD